MATRTHINPTDVISGSREVFNNNFKNLNDAVVTVGPSSGPGAEHQTGGSADEAQIQAAQTMTENSAFNSPNSFAGTILIQEGSYAISSKTSVSKRNFQVK